MTGLPSKYARMGFSKGWRAYKASTRSTSSSSKVTHMARRRGFKAFARKSARRGGIGNSAAILQVDAMAYGAARQYVSNLIAPATQSIPLGTLSDEVGMGVVCWAVSKYAGKGMLGSIARKGLVIENARVGEALVTGGLATITGTAAPAGSGNFL